MAVQNAIGERTNITNSKKFHLGGFRNHRFLWLLMRGLFKNIKNFLVKSPKIAPYIRMKRNFSYKGLKNGVFHPIK